MDLSEVAIQAQDEIASITFRATTLHVEDGKVTHYRAKVKLSFKYEEQPSG